MRERKVYQGNDTLLSECKVDLADRKTEIILRVWGKKERKKDWLQDEQI